VCGWCLAIFFLVILMDRRLPDPLSVRDAAGRPDDFIEERARRSLRALTSVGARPAGSYENEVLAVDLIRKELESIQARANPVHKLSIDVQKPRGTFNLEFVDGLTHSYRFVRMLFCIFKPLWCFIYSLFEWLEYIFIYCSLVPVCRK
jgi:hypothetical protein